MMIRLMNVTVKQVISSQFASVLIPVFLKPLHSENRRSNGEAGDVVGLLVGRRTCDLQVAGSSPGWTPLRSGLGQATSTSVPLSPSSILFGTVQGGDLFGWESNRRPGGK